MQYLPIFALSLGLLAGCIQYKSGYPKKGAAPCSAEDQEQGLCGSGDAASGEDSGGGDEEFSDEGGGSDEEISDEGGGSDEELSDEGGGEDADLEVEEFELRGTNLTGASAAAKAAAATKDSKAVAATSAAAPAIAGTAAAAKPSAPAPTKPKVKRVVASRPTPNLEARVFYANRQVKIGVVGKRGAVRINAKALPESKDPIQRIEIFKNGVLRLASKPGSPIVVEKNGRVTVLFCQSKDGTPNDLVCK